MKRTYLPILVLIILVGFISPDNLSLASSVDDSGKTIKLQSATGLFFGSDDKKPEKVTEIPKTSINYSYINGDPTGKFRPDDGITRAEVASIFESLLVGKVFYDKAVIHFHDVNSEDWYYRPVTFMTKQGYMSGYPTGNFEPNFPITRAELITVLSRYQNTTAEKIEEQRFSDIKPDHWAYVNLKNASEYGWLNGYGDNLFKPDAKVTRAEAVTLINRVLNRKADLKYLTENPDELIKFSDVDDHWAFRDICEAANTHEYYLNSDKNEVWVRVLKY